MLANSLVPEQEDDRSLCVRPTIPCQILSQNEPHHIPLFMVQGSVQGIKIDV